MYATYHMTNPAVFYNKEDQWDIPSIGGEPRPQQMQPYYTIMKLPGDDRGGIHSDAALHAGPQGQSGVLDGGAERRRQLRRG